MKIIHTKSSEETQVAGQSFARETLAKKPQKTAVVLALSGDLGAGKTTFLQGFAKGLGVAEVVNSPTFIIMKKFEIKKSDFKFFYHFDLYRLESEKVPKPRQGAGIPATESDLGNLEFLHFEEIISDPKNIIAIEWPEKIKKVMPKNIISIVFNHLEENEREISINW